MDLGEVKASLAYTVSFRLARAMRPYIPPTPQKKGRKGKEEYTLFQTLIKLLYKSHGSCTESMMSRKSLNYQHSSKETVRIAAARQEHLQSTAAHS